MRIVETKVFNYEELNKEAQDNAIEAVRETYENYNDFWEWAKDDCGLLEPPHEEMISLFGNDYKFPLIENLRKGLRVYEGTADLSDGAKITNSEHFIRWLGLDGNWEYKIKDANILLWLELDEELTIEQETLIENAQTKFKDHLKTIFNRVQTDFDYRFTDEAIREDIEANEYEFTEDGAIYQK